MIETSFITVGGTVDEIITSAFKKQAFAYRDYLEGPYGRLRQEIAWRQLLAAIETRGGGDPAPLRVLDAGCGTGELALRLAQKGHKVTLLDPVEEMLHLAQEKIQALRPPPLFEPQLLRGAVAEAPDLFEKGAFDLVLCHFLLEYLPHSRPALAALYHGVRSGGFLSLVALNRWQEPLRLAIRDRKPDEARLALTHRSFQDSLFGLPRQAFTREELKALLEEAGLEILEEWGIFIFADYLPKAVLEEPSSFEALLSLEEEAGKYSPLKHVARYLHLLGLRIADC